MCFWLALLGVVDARVRPLPGNPRIGEARNPGPSVANLFDDSDIDPFEDLNEEREDVTFPGVRRGDVPPLEAHSATGACVAAGCLPVAAQLPESEGVWGAGPPHLEDSSDDGTCSEGMAAEPDAGSSSDDDGFVCTAAWTAAEKGAGIASRAAPAEQAQAGRARAGRRAPGAATEQTRFVGAKPGQIFTTRGAVTGYYPDGAAGGERRALCLEELLPAPMVQEWHGEWKQPARHRRAPDGRRIRNRGRRAPTAALLGQPIEVPSRGELPDVDWKDQGLWAFDSSNANSWETAKSHVLVRTGADVVLLQEARMVGDSGVAAIRTAGRRLGWSCSASPALPSEAGPASGGCVVAARRGTGIAAPDEELVPRHMRHRFHVAKVAAVMRGGLHVGAIYLKDSVGLHDENLDVLQMVAGALRSLRGPWLIGGDWNVPPAALLATGWLALVGGVIVAQDAPTCGSNVYDYFVVAQGLLPAVAGILRLEDAGLNPHWPCRLLLRGDARRHKVRQLVRPYAVPGLLPYGPLPEPAADERLRPTVDSGEIDVAAGVWMQAARREWASLMGVDPSLDPPRFRWQVAAGPLAEEHAGATAASVLWNLGRRMTECAAMVERALPGRDALIRRHFMKGAQAVAMANLDDEDRAGVNAWLDAAADLLRRGCTLELRRHSALAARAAKKLEDRRLHAVQVQW